MHYSSDAAGGDTQVAEFVRSADLDVADPNMVQPIFAADQPASNHNGGSLEFSPADGYLYFVPR